MLTWIAAASLFVYACCARLHLRVLSIFCFSGVRSGNSRARPIPAGFTRIKQQAALDDGMLSRLQPTATGRCNRAFGSGLLNLRNRGCIRAFASSALATAVATGRSLTLPLQPRLQTGSKPKGGCSMCREQRIFSSLFGSEGGGEKPGGSWNI